MKKDPIDALVVLASSVEEIESDQDEIRIGQWYWINWKTTDKYGDVKQYYDYDQEKFMPIPERELVCVMKLGSNYAEVKSPRRISSRIHLDKFNLELEPNPQAVFDKEISIKRAEIAYTMGEINSLVASVGIGRQIAEGSNAIATLDENVSAESCKAELAKVKESLPELFSKMERLHKEAARIMAAPTMPLKAKSGDYKDLVEAIDSRVLNIDLYAGLSEEIVQLRGGDPADYACPLSVRQRMLYMDEECLPFYKAGGIRFSSIASFDKWICKKKRWKRFLPEDRCAVAFKVRRREREYDEPGDAASFIRFCASLSDDKRTYLYIRNGDQLYRLETSFNFGSRLFPDSLARSLDEPMMMRRDSFDRIEVVPRREYDERKAAIKAWKDSHPKSEWDRCPDRGFSGGWKKLSPKHVYFDDAMEKVRKDAEHYNRVATILQGLFDRSSCLHPHPPVKLWTIEGFDRSINLIFDNDHALAPPNRPDFEAYWAKCNKYLVKGSATIGQQDFWKEECREKYGYDRHFSRVATPWYLKGPGEVARVYKFHPRSGHCTYRWSHEGRWNDWIRACPIIGHNTKVPIGSVFNLDAYKPGDFKRFYKDPRTRIEYLKWAKFLFTAEDYHAGKCKVKEPYDG